MHESSERWDSEEMNNHVTFWDLWPVCPSVTSLPAGGRLWKSSESGILFLSASYLLLESHQYEGQQYPLGFAYAASVPGDPRETETPRCYMDAF